MRKATFLLLALCLSSILAQPVWASSKVELPTISKGNFPAISLLADLPKQFVVNEYYLLRGSTSSATVKSVNLRIFNKTSKAVQLEHYPVTDGEFEFFLNFPLSGSYTFSLSAGNAENSIQSDIRVVNQTSKQPNSQQLINPPNNLGSSFSGNQSLLSWSNKGQVNLNVLTFTQKNQIVRVFLSNGASSWPIDYRLFKDFTPGELVWSIQSAYSSNGSLLGRSTPWSRKVNKKIKITDHHFAELSGLLSLNELKLQLRNGASLSLRGQSKVALEEEVLLATPAGKIEHLKLKGKGLKDGKLPANTAFVLNYTFKQSGIYLLEISGTDKLPLLNVPFYVGEALPFVPDLSDLGFPADKVTDQTVLQEKLLNLINQERSKAKLVPVVVDKYLSDWAQSYAETIVQSGKFSHSDNANRDTETRRLAAGILTPVGENLAQAGSLAEVHFRLMRSLSHRSNLLKPDWNRVGLGIAFTANGQLVVVEEFSLRSLQKDPLSRGEIAALKREIINAANASRSAAKVTDLKNNATLSNLAQNALSKNNGDLNATLLELSTDQHFAAIKNRVMTLTSSAYFLNLAELLAQHELLNSANYKEIAVALLPTPAQEKVQILILLLR